MPPFSPVGSQPPASIVGSRPPASIESPFQLQRFQRIDESQRRSLERKGFTTQQIELAQSQGRTQDLENISRTQNPETGNPFRSREEFFSYLQRQEQAKQFQQQEIPIASIQGKEERILTTRGRILERQPATFPSVAPQVPATAAGEQKRYTVIPKPTPPMIRQSDVYSKEKTLIQQANESISPQAQREALQRINISANELFGRTGKMFGGLVAELETSPKPFKTFIRTPKFFAIKNKPFTYKERTPKLKAQYEVIGQDIALKTQYLIPVYGEIKFASDIIEDTSKKNFEFVPNIITGGVVYYGIKFVGKGLVQLKNLPTQKIPEPFVTEKAEKQLNAIYNIKPEKKIIAQPKIFDFTPYPKQATEIIIGGTFAQQIGESTLNKQRFIIGRDLQLEQQEAFEESVKEAKGFGGIKTGYQVSEFVDKASVPFFYKTKALFEGKIELPEEQLISPQVKAGQTFYPKATLSPIKFQRFAEQSTFTPLAKKYFEPYPQAFNVSPGKLPKIYTAQKGTSELAGQYFAPRYPSTTFAIPKGSGSIYEQYSILPSLPELSGPPTANLLYAKQFRQVNVSGKGKEALSELEPGIFYIPVERGLRSKSESEVIINIKTLVQQERNRYFFIEKTLSKERGFEFGSYFEVPEYKVAGLSERNKLLDRKRLDVLERETLQRTHSYYGKRSTPLAFYARVSRGERSSIPNNIRRLYPSSVSIPGRETRSYDTHSYASLTGFRESNLRVPSISNYEYDIPEEPRRISRPEIPRIPRRPTQSPPYYPPGPPRESPRPPRESKVNPFASIKRFGKGFIPFLFRRGKPVRALSQRPLIEQEAIAVGARFVDRDIKRSFKLVPSGFAQPLGIQYRTDILRRGKRDPSLFVEKSLFALSTRSEVGQIQFFKRQRLGGNRRFFF